MSLEIIEITAGDGVLEPAALVDATEAVHRELRPQLPTDYRAKMLRVLADRGRLIIAVKDGQVLGVSLFHFYEDTFNGIKCYVDDLVTTAAARSQGVGHAMIAWLEQEARRQGCHNLTLDSGTQRMDAHRFYFREGFVIPCFNFRKALQ